MALVLAMATGGSSARAQPPGFADDAEAVEIKLVTFGTGAQIHQFFGHNALWVQDTKLQHGELYNYGMFSFGRDMLPKYLKGRLTFWVAPTSIRATFDHYRRMGRSITVQALNLDTAARARLVSQLKHDALPEYRYYKYHHYRNNCSTKLRDLIDGATSGQLKAALSSPARLNYRGHTRRYAERLPVLNFALMFWMNDSMEELIERWHETFLPLELADAIGDITVKNAAGDRVPLVGESYVVYAGEDAAAPHEPSNTGLSAGLLGLLLGCAAVALGLWRRKGERLARYLEAGFHAAIGLTFGLLGLLGFAMWAFTEHQVTYGNENQLLANPLTFALLPCGIAVAFGSRRAQRLVRNLCFLLALGGVAALLLKVLPAFDQDNWVPMALLLPLNLGLAAGQWLRTPRTPGKGAPFLG